MFDLVVVGSGFYGITIAREAAERCGLRVLILEKRSHIGGNAYSYFDPESNIEVHKYGSHLFHTSNERIWEYVNRFTKFTNYQHRVFTLHNKQIYSFPINLSTIGSFYGKFLNPQEARDLIFSETSSGKELEQSSLENRAISLIGRPLYEAFIRGYTQKQWETDPKLLPSEIISRIPVRYNFDTKYFSDKYEGLPVDGYTAWINRMVDHSRITVEHSVDFLEVKNNFIGQVPIVYSGPIDKYFDYQFGHLGWRTLDFENSLLQLDDFQGNSVINYADLDVPFTRIHEYKHLHPERDYRKSLTFISKEFSRIAGELDEPYYPINLLSDRQKLEKYKILSRAEKNVWFGGRLGSYKYLDMHMAIGAALTLFENELLPFFSTKQRGY